MAREFLLGPQNPFYPSVWFLQPSGIWPRFSYNALDRAHLVLVARWPGGPVVAWWPSMVAWLVPGFGAWLCLAWWPGFGLVQGPGDASAHTANVTSVETVRCISPAGLREGSPGRQAPVSVSAALHCTALCTALCNALCTAY